MLTSTDLVFSSKEWKGHQQWPKFSWRKIRALDLNLTRTTSQVLKNVQRPQFCQNPGCRQSRSKRTNQLSSILVQHGTTWRSCVLFKLHCIALSCIENWKRNEGTWLAGRKPVCRGKNQKDQKMDCRDQRQGWNWSIRQNKTESRGEDGTEREMRKVALHHWAEKKNEYKKN